MSNHVIAIRIAQVANLPGTLPSIEPGGIAFRSCVCDRFDELVRGKDDFAVAAKLAVRRLRDIGVTSFVWIRARHECVDDWLSLDLKIIVIGAKRVESAT